MGVTDLLGEKEQEPAGNEDDRKQIGTEAEKEEENAAEISSGRADQVGFGALGRLGVKREVAGIEREKGKEKKDAGAQDGEGHDLLAKAGSGAGRFWFSHGKGCVLLKRTDEFFQGNFAGGRADLGDNLSPWMRAGSAGAVCGGGREDDRAGERGEAC